MKLGPAADYASPMSIFWMRTRDSVGDPTWPADSFGAFDPEVVFPRIHSRHDGEYVGTMRLNGDGMHSGTWLWSMTVCLAGPVFGATTNGYEATRGDAARAMLDCFRRYLRTRPMDYTREQRHDGG